MSATPRKWGVETVLLAFIVAGILFTAFQAWQNSRILDERTWRFDLIRAENEIILDRLGVPPGQRPDPEAFRLRNGRPE